MEIRKYTNFHAFNMLGMHEFGMDYIENGNGNSQNIVFQASQGYPDHFGVEIRFIDVNYIACSCFFLFADLHLVPLQESPFASEYSEFNIYCFEENAHFPDKLPTRHYIVAKSVEITAHYAGENVEIAFGRSDRIEAGEEEDLANATPLPNEKESKHSPSRQGFLARWRNCFHRNRP